MAICKQAYFCRIFPLLFYCIFVSFYGFLISLIDQIMKSFFSYCSSYCSFDCCYHKWMSEWMNEWTNVTIDGLPAINEEFRHLKATLSRMSCGLEFRPEGVTFGDTVIKWGRVVRSDIEFFQISSQQPFDGVQNRCLRECHQVAVQLFLQTVGAFLQFGAVFYRQFGVVKSQHQQFIPSTSPHSNHITKPWKFFEILMWRMRFRLDFQNSFKDSGI